MSRNNGSRCLIFTCSSEPPEAKCSPDRENATEVTGP